MHIQQKKNISAELGDVQLLQISYARWKVIATITIKNKKQFKMG